MRINPFYERGRIADPRQFIGRWRELSVVFDRLAAGRPVLVTGVSGIGKSSLVTHVAQSAAVNLRQPDMDALYIDMSRLDSAAACYDLLVRALGSRGDTPAALEVALLQLEDPVLVSFDRAESAIAAGWGGDLLERMARIARRSRLTVRAGSSPAPDLPAPAPLDDSLRNATETPGTMQTVPALLIVAAINGKPPTLSEPFAVVGLGALSPSEVRLLIDAYLDKSDVHFSAADLRVLIDLSLGHPAYLQRAAYHLFLARTEQPDYDWQAAYLAEARERPVPGAPLPPAIFEGDTAAAPASSFSFDPDQAAPAPPEPAELAGIYDLLVFALPLIAALLIWQQTASWLAAGATLLGMALLLAVGQHWRQQRSTPAADNEHE